MSGLFGISLSGLNAAQIALSVTGNNLSNVNTDGYNRQITKISENGVGMGVKVTGIERQFNSFVAAQLNKSSSITTGLESYSNKVNQIDTLLGDADASLSGMMSEFFSSLKDLAASPSDTAARQGVIGTADNLTAQFRALDGYLKSMYQSVDGEISDNVNQINNLSSQIAMMNKEISLAKAKTSEAPNALLDERDRLVSELSKLVNINMSVQDNGTYNISMGNGLALVAGQNSFQLKAVPSNEDPTRLTVGYVDANGNTTQIRESFISGGSLGGVLNFRNDVLTPAQNRLGQLAVAMEMGFNAQHEAGVDLNGNPGKPFFSVGSPVSYSNAKNSGTATLSGTFTDASKITNYDYTVSFNSATGYTVSRQDTGEVLGTYPAASTTLSFGGMDVAVSGAPADGDKFLIRPVYNTAQTMQNQITDVGDIAAGQPTGGTGTGDNRNALALQNLQTAKLVGGNSTLNQAYASLVTDIGNKSSVAKVNLKTQEALTTQLTDLQQADSGVNMDEEAANLLRFQQYYQGCAKIIDVASTCMDAILGLRG
ncbi:flagellar hook-associated protein FlgK [Pseudomonas aeruginosa]